MDLLADGICRGDVEVGDGYPLFLANSDPNRVNFMPL